MSRTKKSLKSPQDLASEKNIAPSKVEADVFLDFKKEIMTTLKKMQKDIAEVKSQNESMIESNNEIKKSLQFLSEEYEDLTSRVKTLEKENKSQSTRVRELEDKIEHLLKKEVSADIEIRNIPEQDQENLTDIFVKIQEKIGLPLESKTVSKISRSYAKKGAIKPILVEMSSRQEQANFLNAWKCYCKGTPNTSKSNTRKYLKTSELGMGCDKVIYISERLTPKSKNLFYICREFAKRHTYTYCWTKHGDVYLRKADKQPYIKVKSEHQLQEMERKVKLEDREEKSEESD